MLISKSFNFLIEFEFLIAIISSRVTLSDISILYGTAELLVGGKFTFAKHIYFLRYDPSTYANNIAIIKTTAPMKLDYMTCKPIDLPQLEFDPKKGTEVLVSGWGDPDPTQEIWAGSLNAANFTVVDRSECQERYKAMHNESYVTFEVFCTGGGNVSIESHDAGDPAVQNSMLVGVASYPKGYEPEFPSIFTRVGAFVTWIREIIEKA